MTCVQICAENYVKHKIFFLWTFGIINMRHLDQKIFLWTFGVINMRHLDQIKNLKMNFEINSKIFHSTMTLKILPFSKIKSLILSHILQSSYEWVPILLKKFIKSLNALKYLTKSKTNKKRFNYNYLSSTTFFSFWQNHIIILYEC